MSIQSIQITFVLESAAAAAALFAKLEDPPRAKPTGRKGDPNLPYKKLLLAMLQRRIVHRGLRLVVDGLAAAQQRFHSPA